MQQILIGQGNLPDFFYAASDTTGLDVRVRDFV
jgi:hypothetical protein